ncbi:hypothetical protein FRB96_005006 [Tulasnella sp. 330]|nr:hypothetical protein FRB96_005006 [Tulasnella sp. 330]KAG8886041.1 hypothetical protein FRB97_007917 [Tulasnella sp. 331]
MYWPRDNTTSIPDTPVDAHIPGGRNSVVSFIIGLAIILASSILNAGGLNLTKLDHIRTSALPKSARRSDFLRPLWVLGMVLYILSQLIGSTLALEYMRAEYVAPLGSTSLIFNFLFASFIGIPVTRWDIWARRKEGTVVVFLGVIGIVGFGSINSGLTQDLDYVRLSTLWSRAGWLSYFILMSLGIIVVYIGTAQLDSVLVARSDLAALPTSRPAAGPSRNAGWREQTQYRWSSSMHWVREKLDTWMAAKDDRYVSWVLGIGYSCIGGALAGLCLIFAKATVKLTSGTISHQVEGNQFAHPASIATVIFLAVTAVSQIICLNKGLKVYDSTLVVPMFYGIYTISGFLNSLNFNNEVNAYKTWTLFCLGLSTVVLIAGVVLLTHKKPEPKLTQGGDTPEDPHSLRALGESSASSIRKGGDDGSTTWEVGEDSESEVEGEYSKSPRARRTASPAISITRSPERNLRKQPLSRDRAGSSASVVAPKYAGPEGKGLTGDLDDDGYGSPMEGSPALRAGDLAMSTGVQPAKGRKPLSRSSSMRSDGFGEWEDASTSRIK